MKRVMMFFVMLAVVVLANFYVFLRLWQMIPAVAPFRVLLIVFATLAVSAFFLYFLIGSHVPT